MNGLLKEPRVRLLYNYKSYIIFKDLWFVIVYKYTVAQKKRSDINI